MDECERDTYNAGNRRTVPAHGIDLMQSALRTVDQRLSESGAEDVATILQCGTAGTGESSCASLRSFTGGM